jgi:hypothetical protein
MKTLTLRLTLLVGLALVGCREKPAPEVATTPASPTAVTTAEVRAQELDQDGDGKVDTWLTNEKDGTQIEKRDTDGDGKPDQTRVLEPLDELPPGFELPAGLEPVGK